MMPASLSLSLPRSGWKSTSTPRSLKIWTDASESASEMRTRGVMVLPINSLLQMQAFAVWLPSPLWGGVGGGGRWVWHGGWGGGGGGGGGRWVGHDRA